MGLFGCCSSNASVAVKHTATTGQEPAHHHVVTRHFVGPHVECRNSRYLHGPARMLVPDDKVSWEVEFPEYDPPEYTADVVAANPEWADKEEDLKEIKFNTDGRESYITKYHVDAETNMPRNPMGRTGLRGRGLLGRFGPNFAADPIVTRWKRDQNDVILKDAKGRNLLELVCIRRKDTGNWAIPGGMVDHGESVTATLKREFGEEALNSVSMLDEDRMQVAEAIDERFHNGIKIYEGYCDDPRNTDNAWIETTVVVFHDNNGTSFEAFDLHAGDDAAAVQWVTIEPDMALYASHSLYIALAYKIIVGEELN
eukprot:m.25488 g.25488  ORF g.25488 m.25488 type:complete len:312 (+) comp9865_c0_seq2:205-1140(+)